MKGDEKMRMSRSSSTGGGGVVARKRFMDITNIQRRTQFEEVDDDDEDVMCPISPATRIYIDTLIKVCPILTHENFLIFYVPFLRFSCQENLTLMRLIGERKYPFKFQLTLRISTRV